MLPTDTVTEMDCFTAMTQIPDEGVDVVLTDPPYPNGMRLFPNSILDGYAALYYSCKKARNYVVFFWSPSNVPLPPRGWYEVARHIWHKPDCRTITSYEVIVVWSKDWKRLSSRVWSIPILDYRSLKDWKPHPTQKPVKLLRYLLDLYTNEADIVLDPFVGSGTTAVACKQMHRHFIAVDNDPTYVAIANDRLRERAPFTRDLPSVDPPGPENPMNEDLPDGDSPYDDTIDEDAPTDDPGVIAPRADVPPDELDANDKHESSREARPAPAEPEPTSGARLSPHKPSHHATERRHIPSRQPRTSARPATTTR